MIATCNLCQEILQVESPRLNAIENGVPILQSDPIIQNTMAYYALLQAASLHLTTRHPDVNQQAILPAAGDFGLFISGKMLGGSEDFEQCQREHMQRIYWLSTGRLMIEPDATPTTTGWPRREAKTPA